MRRMLRFSTLFFLQASAVFGIAQTVTAPAGGTANNVPVFTGSTTVSNSNITSTNGMVGIGTNAPTAVLDVLGGARVRGSALELGSGQTIPLGDSYMVASGVSGSNTGITVNRGDGTGFGSIDVLTGSNIYTGWSIQMQPNSLELDFVDRATNGMPNLLALRSGAAEVQGNIISDGTLTVKGQGGITFSDGTVQSTAFTGVVCGGDFAESVDVTGDRTNYEPGDLLVIDAHDEGKFLKSAEAYSIGVTGIYSTRPGVIGRRQLSDRVNVIDEVPMAMTGIVPTKVTAENGPIRPGDLLVSSSKPGYAMKGTDRTRMLGAVIGKALGHLDSGQGSIDVVVSLQ